MSSIEGGVSSAGSECRRPTASLVLREDSSGRERRNLKQQCSREEKWQLDK
jgi:hypothetical protein